MKPFVKNKSEYFKNIFYEYHTPLCIYAYQYVADHDAAKDIVQDVFYDIWIKFDSIDFSYTLKPFLYKCTRNKAIDYLKNVVGRNHLLSDISNVSLDDYTKLLFTDNPDEEINFRELSDAVQTCIDNLPPQCKRIYEMSRSKGLKNREISESLGISVKAVEKQISKALNTLKTYLTNNGFTMTLSTIMVILNLH